MKFLLCDELNQVSGGEGICSCAYKVCDDMRGCNTEFLGSTTTPTDCRHAAYASMESCEEYYSGCEIPETCNIFGATSGGSTMAMLSFLFLLL